MLSENQKFITVLLLFLNFFLVFGNFQFTFDSTQLYLVGQTLGDSGYSGFSGAPAAHIAMFWFIFI